LVSGRRWHFFFAWVFVLNGALYLSYAFASKHLWRDLVPTRAQLRTLGQTFVDHLRLRFAHGRE
jgi:thiosulfate reductase cytochrome b subunit